MPSPVGHRPRAVRRRTLAEVAAHLGVAAPDGPGEPATLAVTGVTLDSRAVEPGDLYAALPGARLHGALFAAEAAAAGARAVLTDPSGRADAAAGGLPLLVVDEPRRRLGDLAAWLYGEPAQGMPIAAVTGTNGKTTVAYLLDAGLRAAGHSTGLVGTVEIRVGDEVVPSVRTTPEAPDLQALLAVMRECGVTAVAMEVSSHALALGRVDGVVYDVAAFTNLSQDHLDFHADLEEYFAAKAQLFTSARARRGVINIDDAYGARLAAAAEIPVVTVSSSGAPRADWRAGDVRLGPEGGSFTVSGPYGARDASVQLPGAFNVDNALLAVATLVETGVPLDVAVAGVARCAGVPGRMERVVAGQPFLAVVDYAHTPDAVTAALRELRPLTRGRLVAVLGCGGDRDRDKRPLMGAAVARLADVAVLTSDNPRGEDPAEILRAMGQGALGVARVDRAEVIVEPDRCAGIRRGVVGLTDGDTIAVLGKGHETGQDIQGVVHPFDDRVELARAISAISA